MQADDARRRLEATDAQGNPKTHPNDGDTDSDFLESLAREIVNDELPHARGLFARLRVLAVKQAHGQDVSDAIEVMFDNDSVDTLVYLQTLDEDDRERVWRECGDSPEVKKVRALWDEIVPELSSAIEEASDRRWGTIRNRWTWLSTRMGYDPGNGYVRLGLSIHSRDKTLMATVDDVGSLARLAVRIMNECTATLRRINEQSLHISERDRGSLNSVLDELKVDPVDLSQAIETTLARYDDDSGNRVAPHKGG